MHGTDQRHRSGEEWAELLGVDAVILTAQDLEWFEQEERWVASARALMAEVLDEYPDEQAVLLAGGDA